MFCDSKRCSKCDEIKPLDNFHRNKNNLDGLTQMCKDCKRAYDKNYCENNGQKVKERNKDYYQDNKETLKNSQKLYRDNNKEKIIESSANYCEKNKDKIKEYQKNYRNNNKEKTKKYNKIYRSSEENKKRNNDRTKIKSKEDLSFRLRKSVSSSVWHALCNRRASKNCSTWSKLTYTPQQLKEHLESLWEPWMSWNNYGKISSEKRTWQIDHIIPQSSLLYDSFEHPNFIKCWSLSNLRPLESIENIIKSNKLCLDNYK